MGACTSVPAAPPQVEPSWMKPQAPELARMPSGAVFGDKYTQLAPLLEDLRALGFEGSELVVAVDFTASNTAPSHAFEERPLHAPPPPGLLGPFNPYERVMTAVGNAVVGVLDRNHIVPFLGFGASSALTNVPGSRNLTSDTCFDMGSATSVDDMLRVYRATLAMFEQSVHANSRLCMDGPTSFAAVIRHVTQLTASTRRFHTLLIITDGQINDVDEDGSQPTMAAIAEAADYPMGICIVGVGSGPWGAMEALDDALPAKRRVDNVQFLSFTPFMQRMSDPIAMERFAVKALSETPLLYGWMKRHGYFASHVAARLPSAAPPAPVTASV